MSDSRSKNSLRNIFSGLVNNIISIILPFINRTAILFLLGSEFTGLTSLFSSILQILNVAELGFNTAIVYSLYRPMAENNRNKICEILSLFRKIYNIVGSIILFFGLILIPFLPLLIKGSYPETINLYILYILYLTNSVISYFLFAYKECLLIADQRKDISNNIRTGVSVLRYLLQLFVLFVFKNFYLYMIIAIICSLLTNIIIHFITIKRYPYYRSIRVSNKLPKDLIKQIRGLMVNRICDTFRNSFDSIIISAFIGLSVVTIYGNYFYIYSALYGVMNSICVSMGASIGNSIIKKSKNDNYNDFLVFSQIFAFLLCITTTCLFCLFQPFMVMWVGDKFLLPFYDMMLFCVYYYFVSINSVRNQYISGNGMWDLLKKSYIIEAFGNLFLNIVLGYFFGVSGVLIATIITILLFNFIQRNSVLFKNYFICCDTRVFYKEQLYYLFLTIVSCFFSFFVCSSLSYTGLLQFLLYAFISVTISSVIFIFGVCFGKRFKSTKHMIIKIIHNI